MLEFTILHVESLAGQTLNYVSSCLVLVFSCWAALKQDFSLQVLFVVLELAVLHVESFAGQTLNKVQFF